jgi:hypothetical protein
MCLARACRSTISAKEPISSFDPSAGALAMAVRRASGSRISSLALRRGMNDALHGRKLGAVQGKPIVVVGERWGSRVSAHNGPGEATLTPLILVRIQVPQPSSSLI